MDGPIDSQSFAIEPSLKVDLLQSRDRSLALFGRAALSIGESSFTPNALGIGGAAQSALSVGGALGAGVRFWPHPRFAVSADAGWRARATIGSQPIAANGLFNALYASFSATLYWGS
jgi:hypothetical protein